MAKRRWLGFLALTLTAPGLAATPTAELVARNKQIVAEAKDAEHVFAVLDDGSLRHLQSGMICPAELPNIRLLSVMVFSPDGSDVGCDYGHFVDRKLASKMSIFATRGAPDATLDFVFQLYKGEIERAHPEATPDQPAMTTIKDSHGRPLTDFRATAYSLKIGGMPLHSELIVGLVKGWMLEVRASYAGGAATTPTGEMSTDAVGPYQAFAIAHDSLQKGP